MPFKTPSAHVGSWQTKFVHTVLAQSAGTLQAFIAAQSAHIVVGWLESVSGRKLTAGSALYSRDGVLQGFSRQTWITLTSPGTQP